MVCQTCGLAIVQGVRFCPSCGTAAAAAAPVYGGAAPAVPAGMQPFGMQPFALRPPRVRGHLQTLGILWCVYGAFRIAGGLAAIFFLHVATVRSFGSEGWPFSMGSPFGPTWMGVLVPFVAVYTAFGVALAFFVGFSLLARKPWGRTLAIVAAILALLKPVLGTALGVYTLWVLAPAVSGQEYEAIADRA